MQRKVRSLVALLALAAAPAAADDKEDAHIDSVVSRLEAAPTLHGELALSLADAIAMGLENNLDVEVQRHLPLIAEEDIGVSWGAFDPTLFSDITYVDSRTPNVNVLLGTTLSKNTREPTGEGGLSGQLPILGSQYRLAFGGTEATTNNAISVLSPELDSALTLDFRQPLLKNLIWSEPWTRVKTSEIVAETSRENFRTSVMDVVQGIEGSYWDLVARQDRVRVAEKSLEFAEAQLDQTRTQYEVGVVSKVEVVEAEAGVAEREFNLIVVRNDYRNAQDALIDQVLGAGLRSESTLEIQPIDRPEDYVPYEIDVPASVRKAMQYRPELEAARREIERQDVQRKFAWNQRLPQLDFVLNWGPRGIAGSQNPVFDPCRFIADPAQQAQCAVNPPTVAPTDFGDSFDVWGDASSLTVGGAFSIPIPNRTGRHGYDRSELELRRVKTEKRRLEQNILLEVRQKARNLSAAQEGIESAERFRIAAEEQLRAERIRLEYGESTPFDVLLRERDLVDAENRKIGALQVYRVSVTELDRAQGTILVNRNIRIDDVSALRLDVR
jgi:HAE1 family hydrophobic/amphiphilic exporter-1